MKLINRTALVTGSAQGIGYAIASRFATEGASIAIHDLIDPAQGAILAEDLKKQGASDARYFHANMLEPTHIHRLMDEVLQWGGGRLDILVNNAGMQKTASLEIMPDESWQQIISVNLSASFYTMKRAMPIMAAHGYGRVINIASVHGLIASKNKTPYVSAKFGLVGLTKAAALEYADLSDSQRGGITANAICPGWTDTALIQPQIQASAQMAGGDMATGIANLLAAKQPSKRISSPDEIGQVAVWLCDPIAHNITGVTLPIDGGWTAQ